MKKLHAALIFTGIILPVVAMGDQASILSNSFKYAGYLDGSFNYLVRSNRFTSGTFDRVFDLEPNGFTLQQAAITLSDQPTEGFGALVNIIGGRDANTVAAYGWNPYFGSQTLALDPTQVYIQYVYHALTVIAGKFVETAGEEVIDPTQNTNFSRAILDGYAEPFTFMGVRGTYTLNDKISLLAGVNNGWDNIRDTSRRKTAELGVTYIPNTLFSVATVFYSGGQRATDRAATGRESIRNLLDIIATYNATNKLTFIANYDYGNQTLATLASTQVGEAVWQGLAGYANYKLNDQWRTSLRGEVFGDRNGYRTGLNQCWKELTITFAYAPIKNVELRAETRHDFSNASAFVNGNGHGSNHNQQSYGLEGYYKFG